MSDPSYAARGSGRAAVPEILGRLLGVLLSLAAACSTGVALAQAPAATEYEVKAAFLYNFAKFVEWPAGVFADPRGPLTIGVLGDDPFGSDLDRIIEGKTANEHALVIRRSQQLDDLRACQILFVSASESEHLARIFSALGTSSILTVGETDQFVRLGGVISFTMRENKVHFVVNADAAQRVGLKISSKLLKVADSVVGQSGARQ